MQEQANELFADITVASMSEWKPLIGFEEQYLIHPGGCIISKTPRKGRPNTPLKQMILRGRHKVHLYVESKKKYITSSVDLLVAETFLGRPAEAYEVSHKDNDLLNDHVTNLEWIIPDSSVEWRSVLEYEGLYEVSNTGLVRNARNKRLLKAKIDRYGYLHLGLRAKGRKRKWVTVHRLVAAAFIPNIEDKPAIDHINGDKLDNRVENLRWVTPVENTHNPVTFAYLQSEDFSNLKKKQQAHLNRAVYCLELQRAFASMHAAARLTGCGRHQIKHSCVLYAAGIKGVSFRCGKKVLHWMWLPEGYSGVIED